MIRNGATDNVLQYLSSSEVLRLKNVVGGQWDGARYALVPDLTPPSVGSRLPFRLQCAQKPPTLCSVS